MDQMIDLSSEDNGLLNSSFRGLTQHQFLEHEEEDKKFELLEEMENIKLGDIPEDLERGKLLRQPTESLEPERTRKNGKCNLRKSLAWDNAFFTSAGFLEPEELSSMLEGSDKVGRKMLPGIQESDVDKSMDSMSTMESEGLTLECLEADLFQGIRASIQRSSKTSKAANFSNPAGSAEKISQSNQSSEKFGLASQNKVNTKPTLKRPTVNTHGSGKMIKESSVGQQLPRLLVRGRESAPSLPKLPKSTGKACLISTVTPKRASFGANGLKMEKDNSASSPVVARQAPSSRTPVLSRSRNGLPRPTQSMRLSSSGSLATNKTELTSSCSSLESVACVLSKTVGKSPSNSIKINKPPSPRPNFALKNKTQPGHSQRSTHLKFSTKFSSSISPASSITCESSSSTSTSKQRFSNIKATPASSSPFKGIDFDSTSSRNSLHQSNDKFSVGYQIQESGSQNPYVNEAVKGTGASAKPSGLRMPSPKIGFFDGVKLAGRAPKGSMKSHLATPSSLSKSETGNSTPTGSNTKLKNIQPALTLMAVRNVNPDMPQITSTIPTSIIPPQKTQSSTKISSATKAVRNCPALSPKDQNMKSKNGEEKRQSKIEEGALVPDETAFASDPSLKSKMSSEIVESIKSPNENKLPTLSSPTEVNVCSAIEVSLNSLSYFASLSPSPVNSEIQECARSPLYVMNYLSNKDELFDSLKG